MSRLWYLVAYLTGVLTGIVISAIVIKSFFL